jgi:HAD superfamily hydrolase (TIGR01509 family)
MSVRAIVFDFDGVLADSEPLHLRSYQEILTPHGVRLTKDNYCERYLGFDDEGAFRKIASDFGLLFGDEEIDLLMREKTRVFQALLSGANVLYPGAAACVERLAAVWPIGIASGALRHEIELMLQGARIRDAFRFIVAAGDTDLTKPAPDPYLRAAELHGVNPSDCIAIEDSVWGLKSAKDAGMRTVGITHTYPRADLEDADVVIDSLDELTERLIRGVQPAEAR